VAFPVFLVVVFGLVWLGVSRCTRRTWIRVSAAVIGTAPVALRDAKGENVCYVSNCRWSTC
jgi:hypothetical protein